MHQTNPDRRWPRTAAAVLPVIAAGVLAFSLIAASGGAPAPTQSHRSPGLAALLSGGHASAKHRVTINRAARVRRHPASSHGGSRGRPSHPNRAGRPAFPVASAHDVSLAPRTQVIAYLAHSTKGYQGRNALSPNRVVPGRWYGHRSALPVLAAASDRLRVRLAQRPNGATTWIKRSKAVLRVTHWAIVVDLSRHFLYVFDNGVQRYAFPVGTGAARTPTPTGQFFVAFHAASSDPAYGPVTMATSAHSTVYRTFDGGDDAIIGIHGPVGSDAQIGSRGASISNGCIRMHLHDLARLVAHVPDGSPVVLTY
jgi:lipoprotein-anchoring transpeptidase ErfK/SrfK